MFVDFTNSAATLNHTPTIDMVEDAASMQLSGWNEIVKTQGREEAVFGQSEELFF